MKDKLQEDLHAYLIDTLDARGVSDLSAALDACAKKIWPQSAASLVMHSSFFDKLNDPHTACGAAFARREIVSIPLKLDPLREEWAFPVFSGERAAACLLICLPRSDAEEDEQMLRQLGTALSGYLERQLVQLNRAYPQDALARLAGEVKTPLFAAISSVQLLEEKLRRQTRRYEKEYRGILETTERNIYRSVRMAGNITDAERLEAGLIKAHPMCGDLTAIVSAVVDGVRPIAARRGVRLDWQAETDMCLILCDFYLVERILLTLLSGAFGATEENVGYISVRLAVADGCACVSVEDNGRGIPESERASVFEKFRSSGEPENGRIGLGLFLAHHFARIVSGRLAAASLEPGKTRFELYLPLNEPEPDALSRGNQAIRNDLLVQLIRTEFAGL